MGERTTNLRQHHLLARRCLACGYDGGLIQSQHAESCPRCDCDLLARPARSYAEMEGLIGRPATPAFRTTPPVPARPDPVGARLIERWLLFIFLSLLGLFAIAALATAAMQPGG